MLYADDAKLYLGVENINDSLKLNRGMDNFLLLASVNCLSVNSSKCLFMSFARSVPQLSTSYNLNYLQLMGVDSMRDLGMIFD